MLNAMKAAQDAIAIIIRTQKSGEFDKSWKVDLTSNKIKNEIMAAALASVQQKSGVKL